MTFRILIILTSLCFLNVSCSETENKMSKKEAISTLKKIEIACMICGGFNSQWPHSPKSLWSYTDAYKDTITDNSFLLNFDNELSSTIPKMRAIRDGSEIDARISCYLYRSNFVVDTLSFGIHGKMKYN